MYHDQVGLIPGRKDGVFIKKITVLHHINRMKIFLIDAEKESDKIQQLFLIKMNNLRIEMSILNIINIIYENPHLSCSIVKD